MKTYTIKVCDDGTKSWYLNDQLHREDGPAIEYADGTKFWYINGKRHREDGPAIEYAGGSKFWCINGKLHREDGPAIEWSDGTKAWYINDKQLTREQFDARNKPKPTCAGKVVEIGGVKYKLVEA